jgi:uncharacterized repeat protein (TIGR01451 family)
MNHQRSAVWACVVSLAATTSVAWAQATKGPVEIKLTAFKVTQREGKEELQPVENVKPGETIEYQARYANTSGKGVKNLAATLPIPTGLEFVFGSHKPEAALASIDGKNFASLPLKRVIKAADGTTKTELLPASAYRFLRWNVGELGAGKEALVSARARVIGPMKTSDKASTGKEGAR